MLVFQGLLAIQDHMDLLDTLDPQVPGALLVELVLLDQQESQVYPELLETQGTQDQLAEQAVLDCLAYQVQLELQDPQEHQAVQVIQVSQATLEEPQVPQGRPETPGSLEGMAVWEPLV